jgi:hypothetical protein
MRRFSAVLASAGIVVAASATSGCGGGGSAPKSSPAQPATTVAAVPATTLPAPSPTPPPPTYMEVLKTFPPTAKMCRTVVYLVDVGNSNIMSLSVSPKGTDPFQKGPKDPSIRCTGTQISVLKDVRLEEKRYKRGDRLTVDKNNNWILVSSWN